MADVTEKYQQAGPKVQPGAKEEMVYTWPYLVSIEAIMAVVMVLALTIASMFFNAPLLGLANPEHTPNPAKAPWYFLGLQELLLHMHPALAGVIVPTAALVLLGMVPYIDRDRRGTGIWFSTNKGAKIAMFAAIYTTVLEVGLIIFDEFFTLPQMPAGSHGLGPFLKWAIQSVTHAPDLYVTWIGDIFVPLIIIIAIPWIMVSIIRKRYNANLREILIGLYSFYFTSFVVLSLIGTAFRGHSMHLVWPWELAPAE